MSELGPESRALIAAAASAEEPADEDRRTVRSALGRKLGAAAFGTAAATLASPAGASAGTVAALGVSSTSVLSSGAVGLALGVVLGGGAVGAIVLAGRLTDPVVPTAPASLVSAPATSYEAPGSARRPHPSTPPASASSPAPGPGERPRAPQQSSARPDLTFETRALAEVQRALRDGHAERALALIDEQERALAGGELQAERAAARVLALCQAGRASEARSAATRFLARWPASPLAQRVAEACGDDRL